jgi:hypothetical protein
VLAAIMQDLSPIYRATTEPPSAIGMGSIPVSGWRGTDRIEDILLRRSGVE